MIYRGKRVQWAKQGREIGKRKRNGFKKREKEEVGKRGRSSEIRTGRERGGQRK